MFRKIFVPLDGSALAENALPVAVKLASMLDARLLLVRAVKEHPQPHLYYTTPDEQEPQFFTPYWYVEKTRDDVSEYRMKEIKNIATQIQEADVTPLQEEEANAYLTKIWASLTHPEAAVPLQPDRVDTLVVEEPATRLAVVAKTEMADLIVMSTHGRSGLSLLLMGSVASELVQHTSIPVILVRPAEHNEQAETKTAVRATSIEAFRAEKGQPLLVTLDGTARAAEAIEPATELAEQLGAPLHLLRVVSAFVPAPLPDMGPVYLSEQVDIDRETEIIKKEAGLYLADFQHQLLEKNVDCRKAIRVGHSVEEIVNYAHQVEAMLIVMGTHARNRVGQILLGSVAEEVVRHSNLPVMLVHFGSEAHH
ncbi:MAG TPA: universal stress protein [Chloroflexia bacterium]|nr:universal stress protein [Chloroflexia bacterium]